MIATLQGHIKSDLSSTLPAVSASTRNNHSSDVWIFFKSFTTVINLKFSVREKKCETGYIWGEEGGETQSIYLKGRKFMVPRCVSLYQKNREKRKTHFRFESCKDNSVCTSKPVTRYEQLGTNGKYR